MALTLSNLRKVWSLTLSFVFVLSAALWDIRPLGERYFDLIPIFIAIVVLIGNLSLFRQISRFEIGLGLYVIGYCIYGYLNFQHRSSILIALMFLLFITLRKVFPFDAFKYALRVVFITTIAVFFAQFFVYHLSGQFYDIQQLTDTISRTHFMHEDVDGKITSYFRPVGLNSEPHSYCVSVALLTLCTLRDRSMRFCHYIGAFSVLLSLSLWGLFVWPCLTCAIIATRKQKLSVFFAKFSKSAVITFAGFLVLQSSVSQPFALKHAYIDRLLNANHDVSISERFNKHVPNPQSIPTKNDPNRRLANSLDAEKDFNLAKAFLGAGLSTALFIEGYPINGVAFIYNSCGFLGFLIFLLLIYQHLQLRSKKRIVQKLAILSVYTSLLLSYPLITYVFFWIFLTFVFDPRSSVISPSGEL